MPENIKLYSRVLRLPAAAKRIQWIFRRKRRSRFVEVAMDIKEELLFDFSINMPRLLVGGETGIVDNVKKILFISENSIIIDHGSRFSAINGDQLRVRIIEEERMIVKGKISSVEFYPGKKGEPNAE